MGSETRAEGLLEALSGPVKKRWGVGLYGQSNAPMGRSKMGDLVKTVYLYSSKGGGLLQHLHLPGSYRMRPLSKPPLQLASVLSSTSFYTHPSNRQKNTAIWRYEGEEGREY